MAACITAGFYLSVPFGSCCADDLLVDKGERLYKVQVEGIRREERAG